MPKIDNVCVTQKKKVNLALEEVVSVHEFKWNLRENFEFGRY